MAHSYTQLIYHIVFSTKDRQPWLTEPVISRVHPYLGGAIREQGGIALAVGGVADHVHLLARLRQDKALSAVIGAIKATTSGWIHRNFADLAIFEWQEGYAAFTVSKSLCDAVRKYIERQEQHRRRQLFKQELVALLEKHGVEYDPRYLWT